MVYASSFPSDFSRLSSEVRDGGSSLCLDELSQTSHHNFGACYWQTYTECCCNNGLFYIGVFCKEKNLWYCQQFMFCLIYTVSPGNRLLLLVAGAAIGGWRLEAWKKMMKSFRNDKTRQSFLISATIYIKIIKCSGASFNSKEELFQCHMEIQVRKELWNYSSTWCRAGENVSLRRIF